MPSSSTCRSASCSIVLLLVTCRIDKSRLDRFGDADWLGIAGLASASVALTVCWKKGQREQWFEIAN
jgi:DHA2 family multidrug resistance protein